MPFEWYATPEVILTGRIMSLVRVLAGLMMLGVKMIAMDIQ